MATTSNLEITASSSSSSPPITWDVFLSFYGKDTRENFISHLYYALDNAGISPFRDDPALEKGQEISSGLLDAIRDSKMFVVVISENYAYSPWCLKELVDILSCKKTENQVVPVFYYVDPSDVRYQKGSFSDGLDYHYQKKRYSPDIIGEWKLALARIGELSGYHLKKPAIKDESEIIQNIVEDVRRLVSTKVLHLGDELFGINSVVEEIYQKLRMESNDLRAIGICGMGGIGKTATAKAFYNKYHNRFDSCCFIENVKQYSQAGSPLLPLLQQLVTALLRRKDCKVPDVDSGIRQLNQILFSKKVLIVLDDPDQSSCSEFLATHYNLLSSGSRIVITTRDVNLLNQLKQDISEVDVYMVNKLGQTHSLEVFKYHVFRKPVSCASLSSSLKELAEGFVTYAGGLPLALKVLGSSLRGRTQDEGFWKAKLKKLRKFPENKILDILQLSYNELDDETVKSMFLDIAFFFVGKYEYEAVDIFKSCDYYPEVGIRILLERCLLTIDENNMFQMHDLIQEMGRKIFKSTRLFLRGNDWENLQIQEDSEKIEGLVLDLTQSTEKQINSLIFERLPKLRLLEIRDAHGIKGHFKNSFHELRCIYWSYCTWIQLPSGFRPQKLISIHMPFSNLKILWDDATPFTSLKFINVEYSMNLKTTPNFGNSKFIERLNFRGCENLLNVHPSITELTNLYILDLTECIYVKFLAESLGQSSALGYLYLGYCSNLRRLPKQLGDMKWLKELDASQTAIEELPDSITQLKELVCLKLGGCKKLRKLPEQIGNMVGLRTFDASYTAIEQLPDSFVGLIDLERLELRSCKNLTKLLNSIWKLTLLQVLDLSWCSKLKRLPYILEKMQCLEQLYACSTAIEVVPDSIGLLSRLWLLDLSNCWKLRYLPDSVWNLTSLTNLRLSRTDISRINLPAPVKNSKLVTLTLKCNTRLWLPMILSFSSLKWLVLTNEGEILSTDSGFSLAKLYNLQYLKLYHCTSFGSMFPELPLNMTHLLLFYNATVVHLPDLSRLKQLKKLDINSYIRLQSLPPLPPHLQSLTVYNCRSLQDVSDMSMLKELIRLDFGRCGRKKPVLESCFLKVIDVIKHFLPFYKVEVPKIANWRTVSFDVPLLLGDNFLGLAFSVLFTCKNMIQNDFSITAGVTNKTNGTTKYCMIPVYVTGAEAFSVIQCIRGDETSIRSGDRIKIFLARPLYLISGEQEEVPCENVEVDMFAVHVMQKSFLTPDFPSALNDLINPCHTQNYLYSRFSLYFEQLYKFIGYLLIFVVFYIVIGG